MELRHFRYFVAVAEEMHFGRAAQRLGISQPPLSRQIQLMEAEIGAPLFRRTRRRVELSEAGVVFLKEARSVLAGAEQAVEMARRTARGEAGRLSVGFVSSATYGDFMPRALRLFREEHPQVVLTLREQLTTEQEQALRSGTTQVGFLRPPLHDAAIATETVVREPLMLALPSGHPLAGRQTVPLEMVSGEPFVMLPRSLGLGFYDQTVSLCRAAGFSPQVAQEASEMHTIVGLVAAGMGVALVPASVMNLGRQGVVFVRPGDSEEFAELAVAYLRDNTSPVVLAFLKAVRTICVSKT